MLAICATDGGPALSGEVAATGRQPSPAHDASFSDVRSILARDGYFLAKSVFAREKVARWRSLTEEHFAFFPGAASEFLAEQNPELSWLTELLYEDKFAALGAIAISLPPSTCFSTTTSQRPRINDRRTHAH